jgi:ADP-ribose pyrophosphatase
MNNKKKVVIKKEKSLLDDYFKVDEAFLVFQKNDGSMSKEIRRLNFKREDSSCALLYNKEKNSLLLVNQFRYPSFTKGEGYLSELPAGIIENNDNPEETIVRELVEETGYEIKIPTLLYCFFPSPGISSERCFLYYAEVIDKDKKQAGGGLASENEDIETMWISRNQVREVLNKGDIKDAKTIIALQWFLLSGF